MEFKIDDFSPSDGIGECESIIIQVGGCINKGLIEIKRSQINNFVSAAVNYLCDEWDYSVSNVIEDVPDRV